MHETLFTAPDTVVIGVLVVIGVAWAATAAFVVRWTAAANKRLKIEDDDQT